jgi:hypothetical protein
MRIFLKLTIIFGKINRFFQKYLPKIKIKFFSKTKYCSRKNYCINKFINCIHMVGHFNYSALRITIEFYYGYSKIGTNTIYFNLLS